jgi:hypothetical protein
VTRGQVASGVVARSSSSWVGVLLLLTACADPQVGGEAEDGESSESTDDETGSPQPDLPGDETETADDTETETETGGECPPPPCEACTCVAGQLECACEQLFPAAGFVELPGVDYELGLGDLANPQSSTDSRQFWAMQPADVAPADAPVFVFFNGGPGVSSGMLLGLGTGHMSFDPALTGPDATVVENPDSWTTLGTLIWIDARQTGFSYGLLEDPSDIAARNAAMSVGSFNTYRDAADFVRTLLHLLEQHPSLQDNPIVLVAESYGGTRAQLMLDMLLHPSAYADGTRRLRDPELVATIQAHHDAVLGPGAGPEQIAAQFGRQILIQPAMTGGLMQASAGALFEQPGSVIEQFAAEFGEDYVTCAELGGACNPFDRAINFVSNHGRSPYDYRAPYSGLNDIFALVDERLNDSATTEALLGVSATSILGLAADQRLGAWRAVDPGPYPADAEIGDWPTATGALEPWDRYFVSFNLEAFGEFGSFEARQLDVDPADPHFGELFASNLIYVDALITEAAYDLIVYTPAIANALAYHDSIVSAVIVDPDAQEWLIEYVPQLGVGSRIVTVPRYEASHAVTLDAPGQLRDDVEEWLGG